MLTTFPDTIFRYLPTREGKKHVCYKSLIGSFDREGHELEIRLLLAHGDTPPHYNIYRRPTPRDGIQGWVAMVAGNELARAILTVLAQAPLPRTPPPEVPA